MSGGAAEVHEGSLAAALRRTWRNRRVAAGVLGIWAASVAAASVVPATTADRLGVGMAGGPAEIGESGGAMALEVLLRHRDALSWALSVALGVTAAFVLLVEPLLRGGWLCAAGSCGAACPRRRGAFVRGLRHWPRLVAVRPVVWGLGTIAAAVLMTAGLHPLAAMAPAGLAAGGAADALSAGLVAAPRFRAGIRQGMTFIRSHPAWLFGWGSLWRLAGLVPAAATVVLVARGPTDSPGRTLATLLLPVVSVSLRMLWLAMLAVRMERAGAARGSTIDPVESGCSAPDVA